LSNYLADENADALRAGQGVAEDSQAIRSMHQRVFTVRAAYASSKAI
jgi:hypothetical protein